MTVFKKVTVNFLFSAVKELYSSSKLDEKKIYVVDDEANIENGIVPLVTKLAKCPSVEPVEDKSLSFKCKSHP